jgi:hypothetical protein
MKLQLTTKRIAFPNLFKASSFEDGGKPKFNAKFVVLPSDPQAAAIEAAMRAVAKEKWGAKADTVFDNLVKTGKKPEVCFVREPYKNRDGDVYQGFEDAFYFTASNDVRPTVLDRDKSPLIAADGRPYAGCYVNAVVEIWAQDNKYGRGLRAALKGVQFVKDGDAFSGGGTASPDDFADLSAGADASEFA